MSTLLPFHKTILERVHDPTTNDLLLLARGLGLRRVICTLLKIYDTPGSTVLLVNATAEEELEIGEELGIMGCRNPGFRVIGYETQSRDRQALYLSGGLFSVTSRILVVDMLQGDLPTAKVTGMLVLHAERVTPLALEAFIVRLFREKNKTGFLKAFTDQPEHISSGMSPLKNIMKELQLRTVHIYPRFQEEIKKSLERRRADVVELSQSMSEPMADIHRAIIQCMDATLSELKRSNATLDLDELTVENAYFRQFEVIVRKQLDSVWHSTGAKTKQLVSDLGVLRRLLGYLLTYDPLQFHAYLETLLATGTVTVMGVKENKSPWMISDIAHLIFDGARRRCYLGTFKPKPREQQEEDDAWAILDEADNNTTKPTDTRPQWLPHGLEPVLEELPKWGLLADILHEIEEEILRIETADMTRKGPPLPGSNVVLVMTSSTRTCRIVSEYLASKDDSLPKGAQGHAMLMKRLRVYLWWKNALARRKADGKPGFGMPDIIPGEPGFGRGYTVDEAGGSGATNVLSEALKKKDKEKADRNARRRRVRGGAPVASTSARALPGDSADAALGTMNAEAQDISAFFKTQPAKSTTSSSKPTEVIDIDSLDLFTFDDALEREFDTHYGLLAPQQTVIVRAYGGDADDRMLTDLQPRFIVMYEPNMDFVRRIEVYRSSSPGLNVRVYHMVYGNSCEEHKYLAGVRKEKDAFQRLIKERGSMLLPIFEDRSDGRSEALIKTISTRMAGGRKEVRSEPAQVIVDMREFRSSLPSLLHASNMLVIPATLTVGDYILTPDICVERKSIPDLVSSFNSGRLYTQCELMSVHYKHPVLLIEFEEDKAFSLQVVSDIRSYAKPTGKYPPKAGANNDAEKKAQPLLQSKLVLLLLSFPRLRIIWASSPHASAEIFADLKTNAFEPDPRVAVAVGAEADPDAGAGVNAAAEELLRCLPGITAKNVGYVAGKVRSVRALCELSLVDVQGILGAEPGKACYDFLHKGEDKR
ncbi:ERCC4 domain-containing protein [Mycena kentingensis (nom. inval.)]|nr:ERCC4 domain-containing protein [Mycena kentingensis (nom. inval.)]